MKRYECIVADPPYEFKDGLKMSKTKRGASEHYDGVLKINDIKKLKVKEIAADDAILALWVPSSFLIEGLDIMKEWGFTYKQNYIWVKTKIDPFAKLKLYKKDSIQDAFDKMSKFNLNDILAFKMGRIFRQTHEICLIGVKGKLHSHLLDKSQRSVSLFKATKHSEKPELLQDSLDIMFKGNKIELFARRKREGWDCFGNECPSSFGIDIRDSIAKLI